MILNIFMMSLKDILDKKQVLKFQVNKTHKRFVSKTLKNNFEGILYLASGKKGPNPNEVLKYAESKFTEYNFKLDNTWIAPQIYFQKKIAA